MLQHPYIIMKLVHMNLEVYIYCPLPTSAVLIICSWIDGLVLDKCRSVLLQEGHPFLVVDKVSYEFLKGSTIEYAEDLMSASFQVRSPQQVELDFITRNRDIELVRIKFPSFAFMI